MLGGGVVVTGTRLMGVRDDRETLYECLNIFGDLNHVDILLFQPIKYKLPPPRPS